MRSSWFKPIIKHVQYLFCLRCSALNISCLYFKDTWNTGFIYRELALTYLVGSNALSIKSRTSRSLLPLYFSADCITVSFMVTENGSVGYNINLMAATYSPPLFTVEAGDDWRLSMISLFEISFVWFSRSHETGSQVACYTGGSSSLACLETLSVFVLRCLPKKWSYQWQHLSCRLLCKVPA